MRGFLLPFLILACLFLPACRDQSKEQILQQGLEFTRAGNNQAAISLFKEALEKDPNYLDARLQLGLAYFKLNKLDFAEKELEKAYRQDPANRDVSLRLAQIYMKTDRVEKAMGELIRLEASSSDDVEVQVALAEGYAHQRDILASENYYRKALLVKPADLDARLGLARLLFDSSRDDAGTQLLQSVIAENPREAAPYYLQLQVALEKGDRDVAISALRQIREIDPQDMNAAYMLALVYLEGDDTDAARKTATEIRSLLADHPAALRIEALADYAQGNYAQAIIGLQKSTAMMQDLAGNYYSGLTYYQLEQYEQALSSFQKALDLAPDQDQPRLMLAQTFLKQGRVEDCIRAAREVLGKHPRSAMAHNVLSSAYVVQGKYDQAMIHLDKAIELEPELAQAQVKKGLFNLSAGKLKQGEVNLQHAVAAAPDALNTRMLLANYYLKVKNYPLALKTMQEGLDNSPGSAILHNNMAAIYLAQKKTADALASLEKAKALKPDFLSPYFNLANYYVSRKDYPAAIKEYQQALKAVPGNLMATAKLAGLYELSGDKDQAELYYKQAGTSGEPAGYVMYAAYLLRSGQKDKSLEILKSGYAAHPKDANLVKVLGVSLQANGQTEEALKMFTQLDEITPGNGSPLLVAAHLQKGNVEAAGEVARRVISQRPDAELGYLLQSTIHENRKDWTAAEENLKRGIAACQQDLNLRMKLASIYAVHGKPSQAIQIYDEILLAQPNHVPALFAKGSVFDVRGDKLKAKDLYKSALALDNDYAPALNNLAYLQMEVYGDHKDALQLAIRAFRVQPEDAAVLDTLGYALLKNGQAEKAVAFLEKAARLRPNDATIKAHLEQARKAAGKEAG